MYFGFACYHVQEDVVGLRVNQRRAVDALGAGFSVGFLEGYEPKQ